MMSSTTELDLRCTTCAKDELVTKVCGKCLSARYCSRECQKKDWSQHKTVCQANTKAAVAGEERATQPLFTLEVIPGKGQGLVASAKIARGTRIISEEYVLEVDRTVSDIERLENRIQTALDGLEKQQRKAFFALHNAYGNIHTPGLGIARTNALPLGSNADKGGVFLEASRINHSCAHNAQNTWNSSLNKLTVHVIRDIEKGEEICISYLDGANDYATRQTTLKRYFKFSCNCSLCLLPDQERQQSDKRRTELAKLDRSIGDGVRIISAPLSCLHDAFEILKLLREEQVVDASLPRLFYDAFQIVIANGDEARAQTFAKLAYDERAILEGNDSPDVMNLKELIDAPRSHRLYGTSMKWKQSTSKVPQNLEADEFEKWLWRKK